MMGEIGIMTRTLTANPAGALTAEQLEQYRTDGYFVVPNLYNADEVAEIVETDVAEAGLVADLAEPARLRLGMPRLP